MLTSWIFCNANAFRWPPFADYFQISRGESENRAIGDLVKERREMGAVVEVKSSARAHKAPLSDHKNKQRYAPKHNYTIGLREVTTSRAFRRSRDLNGQLVSRVYLTDSAVPSARSQFSSWKLQASKRIRSSRLCKQIINAPFMLGLYGCISAVICM